MKTAINKAMEFKDMEFKELFLPSSRLVGFQMEISGGSPRAVAEIICKHFGSPKLEKVTGGFVIPTPLGAFQVSKISSNRRRQDYEVCLSSLGISKSDALGRRMIQKLVEESSLVVPFEIRTPPIPLKKFLEVEEICRLVQPEIQKSQKKFQIKAPCGLSLHPEIQSHEVDYFLNILRAYSLYYRQEAAAGTIDRVREWSGLIRPYPREYLDLIFYSKYKPSLDGFIADYLQYNATQTFGLNMIPAFAYLRPKLVRNCKALKHEQLKARPAFHYRLKSCHLQNKYWSLASRWASWRLIEDLAASPNKLWALAREENSDWAFEIEAIPNIN